MADTLSQALLEASLLSSIPEEDEGSVIIDVDRRTMVLPTGFFFGVYNDKDILKVPFVIPRYYNELDLSEFQITVNYINSAGYGNIYRVTDAEVTDSAIRFKWVTGRGVFVKEGTVRFIVCLRQIGSNGEVEKEFNTTIASANVLKGLEVDENPDPIAYSILAHMEELKDQAEAAVDIVEGAADRIDDAVTEAEQSIAAMYHSPYIATTAADMLSHDKVYVYTGNESGYTFGNWYYWNGSAFVSGGVYNATAFNTDDTLSISGAAADAKKTGDEISELKEDLSNLSDSIGGITDVSSEDDGKILVVDNGELVLGHLSFKQALLTLFDKVAFTVPNANEYIQAVSDSLGSTPVSRLIASTKPNYHVYVTDTLDSVKNQLIVTYNGNVITNYNLEGVLTVGTTTLTVSYNNISTSVNVNVENFSFNVVVGGVGTTGDFSFVSTNAQRATNNPIAFLLKPGTYKIKWPTAINGFYFNINAINYDETAYPNKDFATGSGNKTYFTSSQYETIWFGGPWQNADQIFTVLDNYTRCFINIKKGSGGTSTISNSDVALISQYASLEMQ